MTSRNFTFNLTLHSALRENDDEWEVIEPRFAEYWKSAVGPLSSKTYEHNEVTVRLAIDWAPLVRRMIRDYNLMAPIRDGRDIGHDLARKLLRPFRLKATCVLVGGNDLSNYDWYPKFFLEYFLYEVFVVSNLTCPGAANFFNVLIEGREGIVPREEMRLSAYYFDDWAIESIRGLRPSARLLRLETVMNWFSKVNPRVTLQAESGTQRTLFSLYHLCRNDGDIDFVLWLFNALESLLSTRVGENFSGLVRRAALVLELDAKETATLSTRLRKLYELRSTFIHGGYQVAHPIGAAAIDKRVSDQYGRVLDLSKHGFFLLASLLQRMIEMDRSELEFSEVLVRAGDTH
jgi:hypothetical protein